jgi:membrane protease YdiL (CAAX protease family)
MFGYGPIGAGGLNVWYVAAVSLADTVLLIALIATFLAARAERPRDMFLGTRPLAREAAAGVPLAFIALLIGVVVLTLIQQLAPWLHTVERNPLQEVIRSPRDVAVFALVVIIAGGLREEIQRAFLLRRFEGWVGGARVGVLATSVAFGAGHYVQGADAAVATGLLGAFWAVVFLRRGSVVAPIVSHAGFNLLQLVQFLAVGR